MTGGTSNGKLGLADAQHHQQPMQIYLSKPAGQREGPFTVEQINHDLATKKYKDSDYWAWYDGLSEWVPLHAIPGISAPGRPAPMRPPEPKKQQPAPAPKTIPSPFQSTAEEAIEEPLFTRAPEPVKPTAPKPAQARMGEDEVLFSKKAAQPQESSAPKTEVGSGLPFKALEQIFVFTTGEGRGVMQSPMVAGMLKDVVGAELDTIRNQVARDIVGRCDFGERLRRDGAIPEAAWRAMATLKPEVVRLAREGVYSACVRTFTTGAKEVVALFLFYNKQKM
jgi:hypothetical protein